MKKKEKKNLPANAGDTSLIPDLGRFHTVTKQLSSCATTNEAWGR